MTASAARPFDRWTVPPQRVDHNIHQFAETRRPVWTTGRSTSTALLSRRTIYGSTTGPEAAWTSLLLPGLGPARRKAVADDTRWGGSHSRIGFRRRSQVVFEHPWVRRVNCEDFILSRESKEEGLALFTFSSLGSMLGGSMAVGFGVGDRGCDW